ncbi:MAG: response regulator [Chloroflexota bacterium]
MKTNRVITLIALDDDPTSLMLVKEAIANGPHKFDFHGTGNTEEFKAWVDQSNPDIILLDIHMPIENGFEIWGQIRGITNARIVAYSAYINELPKAQEMGFNSFLAKPLRIDTLQENLIRILNGEEMWNIA